jgi:3-oxoacyl-[acyl-carrier protein] reductase
VLLEGKTALLYGAGGHVGAAVARAFVAEGARVVLTGRTLAPLDLLAGQLVSEGGRAETARLDATDAAGVEAHFASVVDRDGAVDVSFNMIGLDEVQGQELVAMTLEEYMRPIQVAAASQFITATTAARHMTTRRRGVIMAITPSPARLATPLVGGFGPACSALEGMLRTLAAEVGAQGVRVCWLRSAGSPEAWLPDEAVGADGQPTGRAADDGYLETLRRSTLLKRFPTLAEVGATAAVIASDRASAMTAAAANVTCGQFAD